MRAVAVLSGPFVTVAVHSSICFNGSFFRECEKARACAMNCAPVPSRKARPSKFFIFSWSTSSLFIAVCKSLTPGSQLALSSSGFNCLMLLIERTFEQEFLLRLGENDEFFQIRYGS